MAIFGKKRSEKDRLQKQGHQDSQSDTTNNNGLPGLVSRFVPHSRTESDSQGTQALEEPPMMRTSIGDMSTSSLHRSGSLQHNSSQPRASSRLSREGMTHTVDGPISHPPEYASIGMGTESEIHAPVSTGAAGLSTTNPLPPTPVMTTDGTSPAMTSAPGQAGTSKTDRARQPNVVYPWSKKVITMNPPRFLDETRRPPPGVLSPPPFPRYGHATNQATGPNQEVFIFGGLVRDSVKNDMYIMRVEPVQIQRASGIKMDIALNATLIQTSGHAPLPRVGHAAVLVSNVFILWGGDTKIRPDDPQDQALYLLNLNNREWTRVAAGGLQGTPGPVGRYGHTLSIIGSNLLVFGGQLDEEFFNELWRFDLNSLKETPVWQLIRPSTAQVPPRRTGHSSVTYKDRLYIFGGTDGQYHYNDTWCFDFATLTWTELKCVGYIPAPREGHAACMVDDIMYIFGGRGVDGSDLGDLASFKISSHRWFMFAHMGPAPFGRSGHSMVSVQNRILVIGGEAFSGDVQDEPNAMHVLDTAKIKYPVKTDRSQGTTGKAPTSSEAPTGSALPQDVPTEAALAEGAGAAAAGMAATAATAAATTHEPKPELVSPGEPWSTMPNGPAPSTSARETSAPPVAPTEADVPTSATTTPATGTEPELPAPSDPVDVPSPPMTTGAAPALYASPPMATESLPAHGNEYMSDSQRVPTPTPPAMLGAPIASASQPTTPTTPTPGVTTKMILPGQQGIEVIPPQAANEPAQAEIRPLPTSASTPAMPAAGRESPAAAATATAAAATGVSAAAAPTQSPPPQPPSLPPRSTSMASLPTPSTSTPAHRAAPPSAAVHGIGSSHDTAAPTQAQSSEREMWLLSMLSMAVKQGFVPPARAPTFDEVLDIEQWDTGADNSVKDAQVKSLLTLKTQITALRSELTKQVHVEEKRVATQERARVAALQEAAFYRAKLAANESGHMDERARLDRQRILQLEKLLSNVTREHAEVERKVAMLVDQTKLESRLRQLAEDRLAETTKRALAAEESQLKVYEEYSALQKHSYETEAMLRDHAAQISTLTSRLAAQQVERDTLEDKVSTSARSADTSRAMLAQLQEALTAAHARAAEYERQRSEHQRQTESQAQLVQELRRDLQAKTNELDAMTQQYEQQSHDLMDMQSMVNNLQREAQANREAATGGLAQLLAMQQAGQGLHDASGDATRDTNVSHASHLQALQDEAQQLRQLHDESRTSLTNMAAALQQATERGNQLQRTNNKLFAEVTTQRKQLSEALHELAMLRDQSQTSRADDVHHARELEAAQIRNLALRQLLHENHVDVPDDETLAEPEFLQSRRTAALQRELESHKRAAERNALDLQRAQDQLHRLGQEWESHRRQGIGSRQEIETLRRRAEEAERRLMEATEAHEQRTSQLENDYLTAVQFVRNTENMLRRLKDEHLKLRQDNAELRAMSASSYRSP